MSKVKAITWVSVIFLGIGMLFLASLPDEPSESKACRNSTITPAGYAIATVEGKQIPCLLGMAVLYPQLVGRR